MASSSRARQNQTEPQNAFDQLAPYYESTSTEPWDVFINHRGSDVKHTLATTIYHKLHSLGLHVFLDVEALEPGDPIPAELQHAITSATLQIAIFSPNYAQSPWCLAELSFMLKTGAKIIPIFYHVDPSDLRWIEQGKGIYAHAFAEHEKKRRYSQEKLDEWKRALSNISFRSGYPVNNNEDETRVLKNIVNCAFKVMKKVPLPVAEHPVGLDELVQDFQSVASEEKVKITGIVGMGGSGKTTLAKELFNRNFSSFDRCSFVFDVRDAGSRNALPDKQKKVLADLGVHHLPFDNVDEGKAILSNRLCAVRVLIVLDDVDHIDQLNALLPNKDNLGSQSMVIITTRELGVLISWDLSCIYKVPGLNRSLAEQLFCWHAFLQNFPPAEFKSLVEKFIKACNGLPLSLKVLGGQLYRRDSRAYWESQLHKISRILPGDIKQRLQVSYDALDEEEKEMFLDVACFLIGERKSTAIAVWDGSGWSGLHALETLVNKCLVDLVYESDYWGESIFYGDKIRMHDHLRDMGREIASRHSPYRLWFPEQIVNIKKHSKERMLIRGIRPADTFVAFKEYTHQLMGCLSRRSKPLRFSNGLQFLSVEGNEFTEEFTSLSKDLVWLRWEGFPLRNLPSWLTLRNLSVLELHGANELEELWEDNAHPPLQLRELIILGNKKLQRLPSSIGHLQYLKKLLLFFHGSSLQTKFCGLQSLEYLALSSRVLTSLPAGFGNLFGLQNLYLMDCFQLSTLPDSFQQLINLRYLNLLGCKMLSSLPAGFGNLKSLRNINLGYCGQLKTLPNSLEQLTNLEDLNLSYCKMLNSLPAGFGNLISLRNLNLKSCIQLNRLPDSFKQLIHLEDLDLSDCKMLSSLPVGFGNLRSLQKINLESCIQLSMLPDSFKQLIHLEDPNLSHLPANYGNLVSLRSINLGYCRQLRTLPDSFEQLIHLEGLNLSQCKMLSSLPVGFGNLRSLRNVNMKSCIQLSTLPDSFKQLVHLEDLNLSGCIRVSSLPASIGNLISLQSLNLESCIQLSRLPDSFKQLIHLVSLNLSGCKMLSSLPAGFGNLIDLRNLNLKSCIQFRTLPDSFKQLIHLEDLNLSGCVKLKLRLDMLENIGKLKVLNLTYCQELEYLPHQIINQASLTKLDLQGCIKLRGVPTNLGELGMFQSLTIETLTWENLQTSLVNLSSLKSIEIVSSESEMTFDAGVPSSLETHKEEDIEDYKQFCISISNDCCPSLGTFIVRGNRHLMEMETLPVSLKVLSIKYCKALKNIRCISGLVNLEKLIICDCPQLEELASFADLASLQEFEIWNCPKVEKIEGLEHSKSLKTLNAKTCWKVPGIQSLEKVERLETLVLECDTISALKPCVQSIKECSRRMRIQGSVIHFVKPIVKPSEFPDLAVREVEKPSDVYKIPDSFESAAFLCYVEEKEENDKERKVVHVSVSFKSYDGKFRAVQFFQERRNIAGNSEDKKAMVVMGEEGRVEEAFYQLLALLE